MPISWFDRTFSPMNDGSIRAGIFMLIISALGTGILTLHHFFNQIGIYVGVGVMIVVAVQFIFASDLLVFSLRKYDNSKSLNELVRNCLGPKWVIIFDLLFFVYLFLTTVSIVMTASKTIYINFGKPIMEKWFHYQFKDDDDFKAHFIDFNRYFSFICGLLFFFLAC